MRWYKLAGALSLVFLVFLTLKSPSAERRALLEPHLPKEAALRAEDGGAAQGDANRHHRLVTVDFYGESLCPDCQHMVVDVLSPLFENGVASLFKLRYVAYGNAKGETDVQCQHGEPECRFNRYLNCAQHLHPDDWFPYALCFAKHMRELDSFADTCASELSWDAAAISSCAAGEKGAELETAAAKETWALSPKNTFVPWIVVNGVPIGADFENLERYVCAAAAAKDRPEACTQLAGRLKSMRG